MIEEIRIRSLGVIDESVLELGPGLNVVTGETGAGKTMLVTALGLLLGTRADTGAVRTGARSARVEGSIRVDDALTTAAEDLGAEVEDGTLLIARQLQAEGRSRAFLGGAAVPVTSLQEMAERLGEHAAAETHFRDALAADPQDSYLLAAYADFLLERGRAQDVLRLLGTRTQADALLLRHALALSALGAPEAATQTAVLRARVEAARRRGDTVHRREEARFALALAGNPAEAVRLAKLNWAVQKEPADLRILARAAAASGDAEAAAMVRDWLRRTGLQDRSLDAVVLPAGART